MSASFVVARSNKTARYWNRAGSIALELPRRDHHPALRVVVVAVELSIDPDTMQKIYPCDVNGSNKRMPPFFGRWNKSGSSEYPFDRLRAGLRTGVCGGGVSEMNKKACPAKGKLS
jgi:hypothetical protein